MSISPASTRTLRSACIGAAMLGLGLTAWSVHQVLSNYTSYSRYMPRWGWQERVYWTATFMATTAGVLAGPVVCWNSPRNRVGWMLTAVGLVWAPFFGAW